MNLYFDLCRRTPRKTQKPATENCIFLPQKIVSFRHEKIARVPRHCFWHVWFLTPHALRVQSLLLSNFHPIAIFSTLKSQNGERKFIIARVRRVVLNNCCTNILLAKLRFKTLPNERNKMAKQLNALL